MRPNDQHVTEEAGDVENRKAFALSAAGYHRSKSIIP